MNGMKQHQRSPLTPNPPSFFFRHTGKSAIEIYRINKIKLINYCVLDLTPANAQMVAVEHVLDLKDAVNFDRHTSVVAPSCNYFFFEIHCFLSGFVITRACFRQLGLA